MSKDQLLNLALLTIIFTLLFQIFFAPKPTEKIESGVQLIAASKNTTIPNLPSVRVFNNSAGSFGFNTCRDITIRINSQAITFSGTTYSSFCQQVSIAPYGWFYLPFREIADIFGTKTGDYLISLGNGESARIVTIAHEKPGFFRSFFSTVFFEPIYNLFVALLAYIPGHLLGVAIIIITLTIRFILLVPQRQMILSQAKMQRIQPKIKQIQEEFKGDQARIGQEMLALYKKEKVNPAGSCLPLLIQMPILIGLYWVISGIGDPVNHYHLYESLKWFDLRRIDPIFFGINLQLMGGTIGIVFAIILTIVQWVQAKLSFSYNPPPSQQPKVIEKNKKGEYEGVESLMPDPQMLQKMMLYFIPIMVGVSALFFPFGVGLYWFIGTIFVIIQQWVIQRGKKIN